MGTTKSFGSCPPVRGKSVKEWGGGENLFSHTLLKFDFAHFNGTGYKNLLTTLKFKTGFS